jgi:RimJ/RimL family protein N-acetyltransferase
MSDLDNIMKHWNTYEMRRFLGSTLPMSERAEKEWLEKATTQDARKDGSIVLVIEDKKTQKFLGTASLFDISSHSRRAEFGIAIHNPEKMSKGYGTDAINVPMRKLASRRPASSESPCLRKEISTILSSWTS